MEWGGQGDGGSGRGQEGGALIETIQPEFGPTAIPDFQKH